MKLTIREKEEMDILPCECGEYPEFKHIDYCHTDTWLQCPKCGNQTWNTGGYHYAYEISMEEAKRNAIIAWNNREYRH